MVAHTHLGGVSIKVPRPQLPSDLLPRRARTAQTAGFVQHVRQALGHDGDLRGGGNNYS
jgi:hypothetical protein